MVLRGRHADDVQRGENVVLGGLGVQIHEYWLYILDAVPMLAVSVLFNWMHPSCVVSYRRGEAVRGASIHLVEEGGQKNKS